MNSKNTVSQPPRDDPPTISNFNALTSRILHLATALTIIKRIHPRNGFSIKAEPESIQCLKNTIHNYSIK